MIKTFTKMKYWDRIPAKGALIVLGLLSGVGDKVGSFPAAQQVSEPALREGLAVFQSGDLGSAERAFLKAVRDFPNSAQARYFLGLTYRAQDRFAEALREFREALKIDENYVDVYLQRGIAHFKLEQHGSARRWIEKYLDVRPGDSLAYFGLGKVLLELYSYQEAIEAFRKAQVAYPQPSRTLSEIGFAYLNLGQYREARRVLEESVSLDPRNIDGLLNLGVALLDEAEWQEALSCFERILALQSNHVEARFYVALTHVKQGNLDKALNLFHALSERDPDHTKTYYQLALIYRRLNQPEKAKEALETFKRLQALEFSKRKKTSKTYQ